MVSFVNQPIPRPPSDPGSQNLQGGRASGFLELLKVPQVILIIVFGIINLNTVTPKPNHPHAEVTSRHRNLSGNEIVYHVLGIQLGDLGDLCDVS